jgi:hypothetical protein
VIPVFPHYRVSLATPGRYSQTFRGTQLRLELLPFGVAKKSNPAPCPVRHDYKIHDLTNHANLPHNVLVKRKGVLLPKSFQDEVEIIDIYEFMKWLNRKTKMDYGENPSSQ